MNIGRVLFAILLYLPLLYATGGYLTGHSFYGEYLHRTGQWSVYLLLAVLAITPLRRLLPKARWLAALRARRRDLGIAVFIYAAAHLIAYWLRQDSFGKIVDEALELSIATGWIAFAAFLLLALTSNDVSVSRLGRRWRLIHWSVYPAALLTCVHWVLTAFDPTTANIVLGVTVVLFALRRLPRRRIGR